MALALLPVTAGLTALFNNAPQIPLLLGSILAVLVSAAWWRDVSREATCLGAHSSFALSGLRAGMILFIASEVLFFFSFFWAFFHSSLSPAHELGLSWPPAGVAAIDPLLVPLLNTSILLASGATVTWSHASILAARQTSATLSLLVTVLLGLYFTAVQAWEYMEASFTIADSVYGASFFVATGFHGIHVIVGTTLLGVALIRLHLARLVPSRHFGFESAAWYWHFVDVVWLFLFTFIYWWGS